MDCLSPGESRLSFSMSSPPYHGAEEVETPVSFVKLCDTLNSTISPSIFSPQEKRGLKLLKKRDYYQRDLMPGDNFLLLNDKMSGENSSSAYVDNLLKFLILTFLQGIRSSSSQI